MSYWTLIYVTETNGIYMNIVWILYEHFMNDSKVQCIYIMYKHCMNYESHIELGYM